MAPNLPPPLNIVTPSTTYKPVGRCIYCGTTDNLTREHIIPFGIGGNLVLPKSSCKRCAAITGKFEQSCLKGILHDFRNRFGFPTRRKKERKSHIRHEIDIKGRKIITTVPVMEYPRALVLMKMEPPGILVGREPSNEFKPNPCIIVHSRDQRQFFSKHWNFGKYRHSDFCRMIAKIGHSYAIATQPKERLAEYEFFLPNFILHEDMKSSSYFVGGDEEQQTQRSLLHKIELHYLDIGEYNYAVARIRLFCFVGAPGYVVAIARKRL
jgi:hypothetical protein